MIYKNIKPLIRGFFCHSEERGITLVIPHAINVNLCRVSSVIPRSSE